jgi:outer membrane protein
VRLRACLIAIAATIAVGAAPAAGDVDLVHTLDLALDSDPQLAAAESNRLATHETYPQARAALLPQINGSASVAYTRNGNTTFTGIPDPENPDVTLGPSETTSSSTSGSVGVNLVQPIYDHATWSRLRATRARVGQADLQYDSEVDALVVRAAEAYFNVLTAIETLAAARAQELAVKRQLDQAQERFDGGLTPITDVYEARAAYDSARAGAIRAQVGLDDANEGLAEITGHPLRRLRGLVANFRPALPVPDDEDAWVQQALRFNPGLRAAELSISASDDDVAAARAGHYPRLSASASYNKSRTYGGLASDGIDSPDSASQGATVSLQLEVPLFAGGSVRSRVDQALYTRDAAVRRLEQQRRAVSRQTRSSYRALQAGISEIEARGAALSSARSALAASEAGLEVGTRTIVEVLITQQNLFSAQRDYAIARHSFLVNMLRLRQTTGSISREDIRGINALLTVDAESALGPAAIEQMATPDAPAQPARRKK